MKPGSPVRTVVLCAAAIALFSTLYTLAAFYDWWPRLPPGALHDTDLWAGLAGGVFLLVLLLRDRPPAPGHPPSDPNVP